ncbi:MAG: tetratricopeptide repeat protein [Anaerolineae bacterium]
MKKRLRFVAAAGLAVAALCLALGLFVAYNVNQPVVSCASAPRKPFSIAPTALVTAEDYFAEGDYDYDQGDCDTALDNYTRAIELNPNLAEAYNNRAYVEMVKKDYAAALPDLDRAIQLRPNYVNALMNRGDIYNYYYAIDYTRAVADYDRVLQIDSGAANHTSVCGHRLLATQHGWNLSVLGELATSGARAGCTVPLP